MTIVEVYNRFLQVLVDKYGDAAIEANGFTELFNQAALAELSDDFNNRHRRDASGQVIPYGFEMSQTDMDKWRTLIKEVTTVTNTSGDVTIATIEGLIGNRLYHLSTVLRNGKYARYVRHNSYGRHIQNRHLKATNNAPIWRGFIDYVRIEPQAVQPVTLTCIKYPRLVVLDENNPANNIDPDLTDLALNSIIVRMSTMFGVQIREPELTQSANQLSQQQ